MLRNKLRLKRFSCVQPSFLEGMARIMDIGGILRDDDDKVVLHHRSTRRDALAKNTADAIASDWKAISTDLRTVTAKFAVKSQRNNKAFRP